MSVSHDEWKTIVVPHQVVEYMEMVEETGWQGTAIHLLGVKDACYQATQRVGLGGFMEMSNYLDKQIPQWCDENCQGRWRTFTYGWWWEFELEDDATLFKLTWC